MKRSGLKRPTIDQVRAYESKPRKPLPRARKAIAKVGRKTKREQAALDAFRAAVRARARGQCEAPWYVQLPDRVIMVAHSHTGDPHPGAHVHHVHPEDRDAGRHEVDRGKLLCSASHRWTHSNPADAKIVGLLRPEEQ